MSFLPDVKVLCEACRGARFNPETLSVLWKGKSIGDVLAMSVDEAVEFFSAHTAVHHALRLLQDAVTQVTGKPVAITPLRQRLFGAAPRR